jgi:hypothetical protein
MPVPVPNGKRLSDAMYVYASAPLIMLTLASVVRARYTVVKLARASMSIWRKELPLTLVTCEMVIVGRVAVSTGGGSSLGGDRDETAVSLSERPTFVM